MSQWEAFRLLLAFFRVECLKIEYFLMLELWLIVEMRNLAIFRWFLDAFASWMRVYMFYIEKVSKIGFFWLSLFLCYLSLVYSGCHLMGKYMLFVMGFGVVVWLLLPIWCVLSFWVLALLFWSSSDEHWMWIFIVIKGSKRRERM